MSQRISINDGPLGTEITIRSPANTWLRIFLPFWLAGWAVGEIFALVTIGATIGRPEPFLLVWVVGWTVGGGFVWFALIYNIAGRERVVIDGTAITVGRELLCWSNTQRFPLADVCRMRFSPPVFSANNWGHSMQPWGLGGGSIAFEAGGKSRRFGSSLSEDESSSLIDEIQRRFSISP